MYEEQRRLNIVRKKQYNYKVKGYYEIFIFN